jgi:DNA-binding LytR/AlgR family response regulator
LLRNRKMTFYRCLGEFIDLLENHQEFIRTHRSYLVNIDQVKSCSRTGLIKLSENNTAQLGPSFRKEFYNCFRTR